MKLNAGRFAFEVPDSWSVVGMEDSTMVITGDRSQTARVTAMSIAGSGSSAERANAPVAKLHPYGVPAKISDATDPLIEFLRSRLISGLRQMTSSVTAKRN